MVLSQYKEREVRASNKIEALQQNIEHLECEVADHERYTMLHGNNYRVRQFYLSRICKTD